MKTEMKKNNKMFLAMAVVAALAMVSFAGVALQSDDADAAALLNPMGNGVNSTTVIEDSTVDAKFYINLSAIPKQEYGVQFIKIAENVTAVSGTISIGTADDNEGTNYVEYATVKLDGVKNAIFTLIMVPEGGDWLGVILVGDEAKVDLGVGVDPEDKITDYKPVEGTVEVIKGMLMGGAIRPNVYTDTTNTTWEDILIDNGGLQIHMMYNETTDGGVAQFTGTMKAADAVVKSAYTFGIALSVVDGEANIFNEVNSTDRHLPVIEDEDNPRSYISFVDRSERIVTFVSGEVNVGFPEGVTNTGASFAAANVNVVIEAEATLVVGNEMPSVATSVKIEALGDENNTYDLYLIPAVGEDIEIKDYSQDGDNVVMEFENVRLNTEYTLVGLMDGKAYISTFSVDGSDVDYSVNIGANEADDTVDGTFVFDGENIIYDVNTYSFCLFAGSLEKGTVIALGDDDESGKIKAEDLQDVFLLFSDNNTGKVLLYFGSIANPDVTANFAAGLGSYVESVSENAITYESAVNAFAVKQDYQDDFDGYKLTIKGTVDCIYTSANIRGYFYSYIGQSNGPGYTVDFEGDGVLIYGDTPRAKPPANPLSNQIGINAAFYFVNEGPEKNPTSTTFYYTTLNNALKESNVITITGTVIIREDTTIAGPIADEDTTVKILTGGVLQIGEKADKDKGITEASPKVSVPAKTTVSKAGDDSYVVVSGQAIYDVKPKNAVNTPKSDVLLEGDKFIYTDLWTAFDISESGQTIELRAGATPVINKDATLKEGVTLDDKNAAVTINSNVVFTVNGTYECQNALAINGTMRVNGTVNFTNTAAKKAVIGETGAIDIMSSGVVNVGNSTTAGNLESNVKGVITVKGALNVPNTGSVAQAGTLNLIGKVSVSSASNLVVLETLNIGEMPEVATKAYTNPAVIEGKINIGAVAYATAYGDFVLSASGTEANVVGNAGQTTLYGVKYMVAETQLCTVYSFDGTKPIKSVNGTFKDVIISDWNNKVDLNGIPLSMPPSPLMSASDDAWKTAYAMFVYREFKVTFEYAPGVIWTYNGKTVNSTSDVVLHYGDVIVVGTYISEGYTGTPALTVNGKSYTAGSNYTVEGDASFKATGVHVVGPTDASGWTLIEILLVIIVVIIGVIAIIVALRLLRS